MATGQGMLRGRSLTQRQLEVMWVMSYGTTRAEAASVLGISDNTMRTHIADVFRKLGVASMIEAYRKIGWLRIEQDG